MECQKQVFQIYSRGCLDVIEEVFSERLEPALFVYAISGIIFSILHICAIVTDIACIAAIKKEDKKELIKARKLKEAAANKAAAAKINKNNMHTEIL